jgi:hypothetical protein
LLCECKAFVTCGCKCGENLALTIVFYFSLGAAAPSHLTIDPPMAGTRTSQKRRHARHAAAVYPYDRRSGKEVGLPNNLGFCIIQLSKRQSPKLQSEKLKPRQTEPK